MKIRTMTLATVASLAFVSPMAMADSHADAMSDMAVGAPQFDELDSNGDGMISAEELNVYGSTAAGEAGDEMGEALQIDELDTDGDGSVSMKEYEEGMSMK